MRCCFKPSTQKGKEPMDPRAQRNLVFASDLLAETMEQLGVHKMSMHRRSDDQENLVYQVTLIAPGHQAQGEDRNAGIALDMALTVFTAQRQKKAPADV